jgi:hypothetical protein
MRNRSDKAELVTLRKSLGIEAPSYISVFQSRYFYLDFVQSLRDNISWEILVFSCFFLIGILTRDTKYPIIAMSFYSFVLLMLNASKFRDKVLTVMCEEYLRNLKDKK